MLQQGPSESEKASLPKLCYIGNLRIEETSASMVLMYRLLENYPADRLRVIELEEPGCPVPRFERRLPRVSYTSIRPIFRRGWFFIRSRLPRLFPTLINLQARARVSKIRRTLKEFRPEAVLTIHEQFGWLTASRFAELNSIPLHILLHDDWLRNIPMDGYLKTKFENRFGRVYQQASSRLCISPYMEESYRIRYGAQGRTLYPSRAYNAKPHYTPKSTPPHFGSPLKIAYGGNVFHSGYWEALLHLAIALEQAGGQLHLFGPTQSEAAAHGLGHSNVIAHGFVSDMTNTMRKTADALFLPMSFEAREEPNMRVSFPSKLTEYTAAGLPIIIYGPPYCSAVRWAKEHPESAIVVVKPGVDNLHEAVISLLDENVQTALASRAIALGNQYFTHSAATSIFYNAIAPRGNCWHEANPYFTTR